MAGAVAPIHLLKLRDRRRRLDPSRDRRVQGEAKKGDGSKPAGAWSSAEACSTWDSVDGGCFTRDTGMRAKGDREFDTTSEKRDRHHLRRPINGRSEDERHQVFLRSY